MPDELSDLVAQVPATLPPLHWSAPEEIRRVAQRRRQRRVAAAAFVALLAIVLAGAGLGRLTGWTGMHTPAGPPAVTVTTAPTQVPTAGPTVTLAPSAPVTTTAAPTVPPSCPAGLVPANLKYLERSMVQINVYTGQVDPDVAAGWVAQFREHRFQILETGKAPDAATYDGEALLRYGPKAVGQALELTAEFRTKVKLEFDIRRTDETVDVILGSRFEHVNTITEVNQAMAKLGPAKAPKGTCDPAPR